jgi:glucose/arabinose dehydrogenase
LNAPIGTAYHAENDTLLIAEVQGVSKIPNIVQQLNRGVHSFKPTLVREYPSDSWHGAKYLGYKNGRVYVPIGSPCNTCLKDQNVYGTMTSFALSDPKDYKIIAKGLRNSVGFDWHPVSFI